MSWAADEFRDLNLGDKRREARTVRLAERLADRPTASLPGACAGWAETQGAYRLLRQETFDWLDLLEPHRDCTVRRMAQHPVALCIQDTTELDFNGQRIDGLGPLSCEAQRGMVLHPTLAVSPDGEPLGVLDAWMWAREPKDADGTRPGEKESTRWVEGYARVSELAEQLPQTRLVYVGDRESDMLDLMVRAHGCAYRADYLLRSQHNRTLPEGGKLWEEVRASEVLGELRFVLPPTKKRKTRTVRQQVRAKRVALSDRRGGQLEVTCLIMIVAWRIARLMRLGRTCPDLDTALLFSPEEWQAAYILSKKRPPKQAPTLNTVIRLIAGLGGFLGRKGDGEPGMKTLWLGLERVRDFADGMRFAQEMNTT